MTATRNAIPRRRFLQTTAATTLASGTLPAALADSNDRAAKHPNIVFVLADQWRAQATGYAGDPNVKTPRLDRLAGESADFTNAVSGCPVCSPYRGSLMTGQYPLRHGVFLNDVCLGNESVSLAEALNSAGYDTGFIGKWHLDGHGRSNYVPPERRQGFQYWRGAECTHNYNASHFYADEDETKRFWKGYDAFAQTQDALAYIQSRGEQDNPFALILSWGPPHAPYLTAPKRFRDMYDPAEIVLRKNVPKHMEKAARRDLAGYYAHCSALDECLGRILDTLAERGLADDTIVVFTSDHGDMLGSRGEYKKQRPYDESICVPFLVRWPRVTGKQGRKLVTPINTPDIMPTLLGLCGVDQPETVEGIDRSPLLRGQVADADEPTLISCPSPFGQWTRQQGGREYRGVRTSRYTYVRSLEGPWLLYDNQADPLQQVNLCSRPSHRAVRKQLDGQLDDLLRATRDEFRPGSHYIQAWGYKTDARGTVPYTQ